MEKRREILRSKRVCRFCLKLDEPLTSIYDRSVRAKNSVPLPLQIMACVAIEVFPSDGMPGTICSICRHFMDQSYRFKQICKQADEGLRHFLTHGDLRDPIPWPRDMMKHIPETLISPVVQQTITVTEEEYSEGEEGESQMKHEIKEEEVEVKVVKARGRPRKRPPSVESNATSTNVIITPSNSSRRSRKTISLDDSEEPPTKIRVTQRGEELLITAHGDDDADEDIEDEEEILNNQPETVETDVFPCPDCLRSFPLKQLLDIHQEQHTRERTHHCELCERSFFSKFDLQKHMVIHSGLKPYKCVICRKTFARLTLLRRHEKVHANVERMHCNECSQSFITADDLDAHVARKHSVSKPFQCNACPKTFAFKQGLDRHALNHSQEQPFRCNYCPLSFSSSTRLARHLQCHAGQRPYPCKFCPKSFLMSHHYMRHLRTKHIAKSGGEKTVDSYKCVQCDELFDKQDDLIFHSAIHATQDLTCPLCKEKFEDVDSVTMHIKSHIDCEQYICEWCELVFTCEENLDLHIDTEHKDAMPGDPFTEITYLEGRLVDESELLQMNQSYEGEDLEEDEVEEGEVDSMYDARENETKEDIELEVEEEEEEDEEEEEGDIDEEVVNVEELNNATTDELSFEMNVAQPVDSPQNNSEDDSKPTYIELKTVAPTQVFTKKPIEIVQKNALTPSAASLPKSSILQKAQEVKAQRRLAEELKEKQRISSGTQKVESKSFKPIPIKGTQETLSQKLITVDKKHVLTGQVQKVVMKAPVTVSNQQSRALPVIKKIEIISPAKDISKDNTSSSASSKDATKKIIKTDSSRNEEKVAPPVSRTNEKSLKLLEKDLLELQKVAKSSNSSDRYISGSQRFLSRKPLSPTKRDHDNRDSKSSSHRSDDRDSRIATHKRTHDDRDSKSSSKRDQDDLSKIRSKHESSKIYDDKDFKKSSSKGEGDKDRKKISESVSYESSTKKSSEVFKSPQIIKKNDGSISVKKGFMQRDAEKNKSLPVASRASSSEVKLDDDRSMSPSGDTKSDEEDSGRKSSISDEDSAPTRRSCRPSKIKDYAAMIRDRSRLTREGDDSDDDSDDDYNQTESEEDDMEDEFEINARPPPAKLMPISSSTPLPSGKRGRGRPRKTPIAEEAITLKVMTPTAAKTSEQLMSSTDDLSLLTTPRPKGRPSKKQLEERARVEAIARDKGILPELNTAPNVKRPRGRPPLNKSAKPASPANESFSRPKQVEQKSSPAMMEKKLSSATTETSTNQPMRIQKIEGVVQSVSATGKTVHMTPLGQTLKKVSAEMVRSLPPGVRPLPMPPRKQVTQMKIGPRIVRVQKILMTKAEVDAMAKKGLVEIKDGAVVLKAGVKLPASGDFSSLKSTLTAPNAADTTKATPSNSKEPEIQKIKTSSNDITEEHTPSEEKITSVKEPSEPAVKAALLDKEPAKPSRCQEDVLSPDENDIIDT